MTSLTNGVSTQNVNGVSVSWIGDQTLHAGAGGYRPQTTSDLTAPYNYTDLGYVQQTVSSASAGLSTIPPGALYALITVEGAAIRYRGDGVAPTATVGIPVAVGQQILVSTNLANLSVIQQAAGALINIQYLK